MDNQPSLRSSIWYVITRSLLGIGLLWVAQFLYHGVSNRLRFRRMKGKGLPVPEPHSLLLGHLPLMKGLRRGLPKDAHDTYAQRKLTINWKEYFPKLSECPPVIYLDLWPFLSYSLIQATSPEACYQMTQQKPQPRHPMFSWAISPVTGGRDLIAMDIPTHRVWRSRLNPGFSLRNLTSLVPILMEEVDIFVQKLREEAGTDKAFGALFPLYDKTVNLSFDIIMRAALDLRVHEQTEGPGALLKAMRQLNTHVNSENIKTKIQRMMPAYRRDLAANTRIIDNILRPYVLSRANADMQSTKTKSVIDLALGEIRLQSGNDEDVSSPPSQDLVDIVISQLKLFLLAGHHTTAQAICWVMYEVYSRPEVLEKIRDEVRRVLGPDAKSLLQEKPHHLNELEYTAAVIKETLRLNPIASTHRQGSDQFNLVIEGTTYPTLNTLMNTSPVAVHLRSDLWPRATEFLPERFMVGEDDPLHPFKHAWRAFELGTTRCIGEELAMIEIKLILASTTAELDLEYDWAGWRKTKHGSTPPETVNGMLMYRTGQGIGTVKDDLPTRVRLR
ncbi:cytochrome P450 [Xylariaceae sp. FL1272]|nr:cytochrome P450 [Xylariaceae sp. FL1272]